MPRGGSRIGAVRFGAALLDPSGGIGRQEGFGRVDTHRSREEVALAEGAAEAEEPGGLVGLLYALGNDLEPGRPAELDDRPSDGRPVGAGRHPGDERAVDLE